MRHFRRHADYARIDWARVESLLSTIAPSVMADVFSNAPAGEMNGYSLVYDLNIPNAATCLQRFIAQGQKAEVQAAVKGSGPASDKAETQAESK